MHIVAAEDNSSHNNSTCVTALINLPTPTSRKTDIFLKVSRSQGYGVPEVRKGDNYFGQQVVV